MKMENQSLLSVPSSDSGRIGPKNDWDKAWPTSIEGKGLVREGSPSINLGLWINAGSGEPSHVTKQAKSVFTPGQLHELHQQALILKYIVAGLPVPFHLLLPIWKSVVSSFGSGNGGIYNQYPSFIGFSPRGFDYRSMMDSEPGRCRRTDGKKWRCSRNVVPDHKYCEWHIHRGRQCSRKLVEATENIQKSDTNTKMSPDNTTTTIKPSNANINFSIAAPADLQLTTPSSNTSNNVPATVNTTITTSSANGNSRSNNLYVNKDSSVAPATIDTCNGNLKSNSHVNFGLFPATTTTTTATFNSAATDNSISRNNNNYLDGKDAGFNHVDNRNINRSNNNGNNGNFGSFVAPRIGFSPKSVLHGSTIVNNCIETEQQRCRRTDGKKWRCRMDVVPEQKYCGRHMHRGAKKLMVASESVTVAAAAPPLCIPKTVNNRVNLNTNLSSSIVGSPQQMSDNENNSISGGSSSSDATTITDENTSVSHILALSP